jgi:hypothetical protein
MATQAQEETYVVVVWNYDAAPDALDYHNPDDNPQSIAPYFEDHRRSFSELWKATSYARCIVKQYPFAPGAGVFKDGELVEGFGLTFKFSQS